jgi:membrane protein implicated in regulation of membrane protease activity
MVERVAMFMEMLGRLRMGFAARLGPSGFIVTTKTGHIARYMAGLTMGSIMDPAVHVEFMVSLGVRFLVWLAVGRMVGLSVLHIDFVAVSCLAEMRLSFVFPTSAATAAAITTAHSAWMTIVMTTLTTGVAILVLRAFGEFIDRHFENEKRQSHNTQGCRSELKPLIHHGRVLCGGGQRSGCVCSDKLVVIVQVSNALTI